MRETTYSTRYTTLVTRFFHSTPGTRRFALPFGMLFGMGERLSSQKIEGKRAMGLRQKLKDEIKRVVLATLYFATWIGVLIVIKELVLAEYGIEFRGLSLALVGALVLAKVVLVLEHVPLGAWIRTRPALIDVIVRTVLYALGVLAVLLLEKAFEARHEHGGFVPSLMAVLQHAEIHHVWVNTICLSGALLVYNVLSVVRRHLGEGALIRLFLLPLPEKPKAK